MQHVTLPARTLDDKGRCCGRKPLVYKRPAHRLFCHRCCAEFSPSGVQRQNWAWETIGADFRSAYPVSHDYVQQALKTAGATPDAPEGDRE